MTVPNEILDSLLSGYLDDALTVDERVRVERMLASDADVRSDLESIRELREMLRYIDRTDRAKAASLIRPAFSERIIDAAIECARSEGVSEDHPLLRSTEAPSYRRARSTPGRRLAIVVAALAASGLIGAIVFGPDWTNTTPNQVTQRDRPTQGLASFESSSTESSSTESIVADAGIVGPVESFDAIAKTANPERTNIASQDVASQEIVASDTSKLEQAVMSESLKMSEPDKIDTPPMIASDAGSKPNVAAANPNTVPGIVVSTPVFVFDVRVSDQARGTDPIRMAMEAASISPVSQKAINAAMVGSLSDAVRSLEVATQLNTDSLASEISGKVIYIEASAKKIDRLMSVLWADDEGIESFRFNMAMKTPMPLENVVESLSSVRATDVRHGQTIEFNGELEALSRPLAKYLGSGDFNVPKTPRTAPAIPALDPVADGREEDANDFMSRVFLIVR